ncbi:hypothetical protein CFC21_003449 [Triticum aestivum]|uniref:rRNA N-glycosylase n=2 Tax=Triticum TaxID=4564 RepID=A0A9R0V1T0_TRITD|nr:uncharacterized protein LOC123063151 [Triticum aestivum]KAF6985609.1 hypothetical protein CFC21_003449 [Triticum aestivum]VAH09309.1 unnamed protein product [Triticum turgidum subsp. durum]
MPGVNCARGTKEEGAFEGATRRAAGRWPKIFVTLAMIVLFVRAVHGAEIAWEHDAVRSHHTGFLGTTHTQLIESVEEDYRRKIGDVSDLMAPQRGYHDKKTVQPATWLKPTLKGRGDDKVTLWLCNDDLYLLAFNTTSNLHTAKGYDALFTEPFLPLPFGSSYKELMGHTAPNGDQRNAHLLLVSVPLGRESLLDAIHVLSNYDPVNTPKHEVQLAMAKITLMGPESLRFHPVRNAYILEWESEESYLTLDQAKYLVNWSSLSTLLVQWEDSGRKTWPSSNVANSLRAEFGIKSGECALGVIDLVLRPR